MVTDERRRQLLKEHFSARVGQILGTYGRQDPGPQELLARGRLKRAVSTVCHNVPSGGAILDLGCGCGLGAATLAQLGYRVTAVDLIPELIEQARAQHSDNVTWLCQPFDMDVGKKQSFDAVLSLGFLEYQERAGKELVRMRRLLKPGGLLILSVPNTLSGQFRFGVTRAIFRLSAEPEGIPVRHSFTPERLQRLLGMAGFIFIDYEWLPQGEGDSPLSRERSRDLWNHRLRLRTSPELFTMSRTYKPEDTSTEPIPELAPKR
jgi:2-polyprenyl-3-methyl-5-hydroxy-6-metoxy-1,4-benzoquinol methylase